MIPCNYLWVSSPFGEREHPVYGTVLTHNGIDLAAYGGTPIYASRTGQVTTATYGISGGYYVTINHGDGYSTSYLHMTHFIVQAGDFVAQGQVIGYVGSTGTSTGILSASFSLSSTLTTPAKINTRMITKATQKCGFL
jgi:murein DD-endopeptidase MepM/ murein hydrolase activator NlpD